MQIDSIGVPLSAAAKPTLNYVLKMNGGSDFPSDEYVHHPSPNDYIARLFRFGVVRNALWYSDPLEASLVDAPTCSRPKDVQARSVCHYDVTGFMITGGHHIEVLAGRPHGGLECDSFYP